MAVNPAKEFIFIWVPGTGGHEVHPGFQDALDIIVPDQYQVLCVDYPASWHLESSVADGVQAFATLLSSVDNEVDRGTQRVMVAGSSQGSWVISETYEHSNLSEVADKTVMFGHPGLDDDGHYHDYHEDSTVWEINHPDDAVTFSWKGREAEIADAFSKAQRGNVKAICKILWLSVCHPIRVARLLLLILYHIRLLRFNTSPHDYSQVMPLAVYWLLK